MNNVISKTSNITLDDHVEDELKGFLNIEKPTSFFLFAGAGSGKTRSLVQMLKHIAKTYRDVLRLQGQNIAVITYTKVARDEIIRRMEYDPLFSVSTIHSFAWSQIEGFNSDIRDWLNEKLSNEILELEEKERRARKAGKTNASIERETKIASKKKRLEQLPNIKKFNYNPDTDDQKRDALNHVEVINLFSFFLMKKPLMQRMFVNKFPFLLIDESQDTFKNIIDAFFLVQNIHKNQFCLGLIGDTMQRIYHGGKDEIENELPEDWKKPEKKLNHRSSKRIVRLINQIRSDVDHHDQEPRDDSPEGFVRFFVFPNTIADKTNVEQKVRESMAHITGDMNWETIDKCKILALEHRMVARRMGFINIFEALFPIEAYKTSFLDGTLMPMRLFTQQILPLVKAQKSGDKFAVSKLIRENSPLLSKEVLKKCDKPVEQLQITQTAIDALMKLWVKGAPRCADIIKSIAESNLFSIPDNLNTAAKVEQFEGETTESDEKADPVSDQTKALINFLNCSFSEIEAYALYISGGSSFGTHQGVKGLEFDRVLALIDDDEARGFLFKYDKILGAEEPSDTDVTNVQEGKETSLDRTRRLFYVICSRAKSSLALVVYSSNPEAVKDHVISNSLFLPDEVISDL